MKKPLHHLFIFSLSLSLISCAKVVELKQWGEEKNGSKTKWIKLSYAEDQVYLPSLYSAYDDLNSTLYYVNKESNILYAHNIKTQKVVSFVIKNPIFRTSLISSRKDKLYGKSEFGRDIVYEFDFKSNEWINPTNGNGDYESFGHATYYNPIAHTVGFFGGYGFYQMKNFIWEIIPTKDQNWMLIQPDSDNSTSKGIARGVKNTTYNKSGSKLYLYGGQGNYSGSQFDPTCTSSITPMPTTEGSYCWLRDLWVYDFNTRTFKNIISPFSDKLPLDGAMAYNEDNGVMYLMGGRKPPFSYPDHTETIYDITLYKTPLNNIQFKPVKVDQTVLPSNQTLKTLGISVLYYDHMLKTLIWVNSKGIFLLDASKIK